MPRSNALKKDRLHLKGSHGAKTSGHQVDYGTYTHEGDTYTPWITKLNKHAGKEGGEASLLEVGFSAVASLFIKPGLTPRANIVIEERGEHSKVVGVASENFNASIKQQMDAGIPCYSFDANAWQYKSIVADITPAEIVAERDKLKGKTAGAEEMSNGSVEIRLQLEKSKAGVNFLDHMPKDFFAELMERHNRGEVMVDMESLASIFTASYVLEEDDLHKGNIGFYVTDVADQGGCVKKKFNFFKIDHDLMFAESIMSQKDMRVANLFYTQDSFNITTRDLDGFPDLRDSGNHYWPTKKRLMTSGNKAYDGSEIQAFAQLRSNPSFMDAKWKYFLKSAVMPSDLIDQSLTAHLDPKEYLDKINMIRNSVGARMAQLRNRMLESKPFKDYLAEKGEGVFAEIKEEVEHYIDGAGIDQAQRQELIRQLQNNFNMMKRCAANEGLSSIQKSILLDSYAFSLARKPTEKDINVAMDCFGLHIEENKREAFKFACIAQDLISKSDHPTDFSEQSVALDQFKKDYLNPKGIKTFKEFEDAANKIRASNLPLKQQKNEILAVLKQSQLPIDELHALKKDLKKDEPDSPSLKFIAQLRSELWIVRLAKKIVGVVVGASAKQTETSSLMIHEIDAQIKQQRSDEQRQFKARLQDTRDADGPVVSKKP